MRIYNVPNWAETITLGCTGENLAQKIVFDISPWVENFGPGSVSLLVRRSREQQPYPVTLTVEDGKASWVVTDIDTAQTGFGQAELVYLVGNAVVKSRIWQTYIAPSLDGSNPSDPTKDPWAAYIASVAQYAAEAREAAQKAQDALSEGDNRYLQLSGGTITGPLHVPYPASETEATNRKYVNGLIGDIDTILDAINGEVV